jgi:hypothetical protein
MRLERGNNAVEHGRAGDVDRTFVHDAKGSRHGIGGAAAGGKDDRVPGCGQPMLFS